ncbi:MAG TPA: small ribosomal subunit Rsm22 family protein [bacterium]|nr:small ribosomal subunit Rsm22 family protein [bacterium]
MNDKRHDSPRPRGSSAAHRHGDHAHGNREHAPEGKPQRPRWIAPPRVEYRPTTPRLIVESSVPVATAESARLVSSLLDIVEEVAPLPSGRRKDIRRDVLELWRELTSEKSTRQADYIGEPARLAAYLRYFLPWNVVRLAPILAGLDLGLSSDDHLLDIGSGPLTVPIALWIARPDLRALGLNIVCVDRVRRVMELGVSILEGLALRAGVPFAWTVELRKESFSIAPDGGDHQRYALVTAANVFNESFWKLKGSLAERGEMLAASLAARTAPGGRFFIVEPGDPRSGAMLASLREATLLAGGRPIAPCPHDAACPMAGAFLSGAFRKDDDEDERPAPERTLDRVVTARGRSKAPWCHFVIDSGAAPQRLLAFSESAGLPKDRLIASWLLMQPDSAEERTATQAYPADRSVRIITDSFRLPDGGMGRYACTKTGYTLVRGSLADMPSGTIALLDGLVPTTTTERDPKSNAVILKAYTGAIPFGGAPPVEKSHLATVPDVATHRSGKTSAAHSGNRDASHGGRKPSQTAGRRSGPSRRPRRSS